MERDPLELGSGKEQLVKIDNTKNEVKINMYPFIRFKKGLFTLLFIFWM